MIFSNSSVSKKTKITDDIIVVLNSGVVKNNRKCTYVGVPDNKIRSPKIK